MIDEIQKIIGAISIIVVLFVITIVKYYREKKVFEHSDKVKKLLELNKKYQFRTYLHKRYKIIHYTKSRASLRKISFEDIIIYHIENNIKNIRDDLLKLLSNNKTYIEYLNEVNAIENEQSKAVQKPREMIDKKFTTIEKRLLKRHTITPPKGISAKVIGYYVTPKRKYYYVKKCYFTSFQLQTYLEIWQQKKNYQISAKFERTKMSDSLRYDVLKKDNFKCKMCGYSASDGAKLHVDHIKPVSKGGKTEINNLQTLCERCNLGKSDKE